MDQYIESRRQTEIFSGTEYYYWPWALQSFRAHGVERRVAQPLLIFVNAIVEVEEDDEHVKCFHFFSENSMSLSKILLVVHPAPQV